MRSLTTLIIFVVVLSAASGTIASRQHGHRRPPARSASAVVTAVEEGGELTSSRNIKYANFDDYLMSIGAQQQRSHNQVNKEDAPRHRQRTGTPGPTDDEDMTESSGEGDDTESTDGSDVIISPHNTEERKPEAPSPAYDLDILGYFRDVPREHWSCCMLGKLAGDKGFHCYAGFYAARIQARNFNRAHNKKMHFHGHDAIPNWGQSLMHTFQRCVATHGDEFHKCCYAATIEKRERHKWSRYASQKQQQNTEDAATAAREAQQQQQQQEQIRHQRRQHLHQRQQQQQRRSQQTLRQTEE